MKYVELWNRFIDEIYLSFLEGPQSFSDEQKHAFIAFAYDAEVNNGGHLSFFDCYGEIFSIDEIAEALRKTVGEKFASNFLSAAGHIHYTDDCGYMPNEESDADPLEDDEYYKMNPNLPELLEIYIFNNQENIFVQRAIKEN